MHGIKCYIQCRCFLQQFKNHKNIPFHKFECFVAIDDNDDVIKKYVQCDNCGLIHRIVDISKSEILSGKEHLNTLINIEDIKQSMNDKLRTILELNNASLATWEQAQFIYENKKWDEFVVLSRDKEDNVERLKILRILGEATFKIVNEELEYTT